MGIPTVHTDSNANCWVGIDVSKDWIDVVVLVEENKVEQFRCERSAGALAKLAKTLLPYRPQGVVLEATGGLEGAVIAALVFNGLSSRCLRHPPCRARGGGGGAGVSHSIVAPLPGNRILDRIQESLVRDPSGRRLE